MQNIITDRQGQGGRAGWQSRVAAKIEEHNSAVKQQILDTLVRTPLLIGLLPAPICLIKPRLIAISEKISFCHSVLTNSLPVICSNESSQIRLLPWFLLPTINDNYQRFYRFRKKPIDLKFPFFSPRQQPQDQSRSECEARPTVGLSCSILRDRIMICLNQTPLLNNHSRLLTCKNYNNRNKYLVSTSPPGHEARIYEVFEGQTRSQLCFSRPLPCLHI